MNNRGVNLMTGIPNIVSPPQPPPRVVESYSEQSSRVMQQASSGSQSNLQPHPAMRPSDGAALLSREQILQQRALTEAQRAQNAAGQVSNTRDDVADLQGAIKLLIERNENLENKVKLISGNLNRLNSFVRASINFISDTDHSHEFISKHLDFFYALLREEGLTADQAEGEESKEEQGDSIRGDIANRLNSIH